MSTCVFSGLPRADWRSVSLRHHVPQPRLLEDHHEVVDSICLRELVVDFVDAGFGVRENEEVVDVYCDDGEVVVIVLSNKY